MTIRVVMAGATGWVGKALVPAIVAQGDMELAGAVSRRAARAGYRPAIGHAAEGRRSLPPRWPRRWRCHPMCVVDYTKPNVVKDHALRPSEAAATW